MAKIDAHSHSYITSTYYVYENRENGSAHEFSGIHQLNLLIDDLQLKLLKAFPQKYL